MKRGLDPRTFLVHGLIAGLLAGVAVFVVAYLTGEPHLDAAIRIEEARAHGHEHELVSRGVQSTLGLLTASVVISTMLGGLTGLVAALAMGRLGRLRPVGSTALVAGLGYLAVGLLPSLKYPANPPTVGDPTTIDQRTALYFGYQLAVLVAVLVAVVVGRRLLQRYDAYTAIVAGAGVGLVLVVGTALVFPTVDEVGRFPASLLWQFRLSSLFVRATLWGVIGIVLAGLVGRVAGRVEADRARREFAASL